MVQPQLRCLILQKRQVLCPSSVHEPGAFVRLQPSLQALENLARRATGPLICILFGLVLGMPDAVLGRMQGDEEAQRQVEALAKAKTYTQYTTARDALAALGERAAGVLPALVRLLDDKEYYVRRGAEETFKKLGVAAAPAAPAMLQRLRETSENRRAQAVSILVTIALDASRSELELLARSDPAWNVRLAALGAVTSSQVLAEVIRTDKIDNVRREALRMISDQRVLGELVKGDLDQEMRDAAFEKISDRSVLLDLATCKTSAVRVEALQKLPSFTVAEVVAKNSDPLVRRDAVWALEDADLLLKISRTEADKDVCEAAKLSAAGKKSDLKVSGLDCRPEATALTRTYTCYVQLVNQGSVAYTNIKYILGSTFFSVLDAQGAVKRLNGTVEPGETKDYTIRNVDLNSYANQVQFRLVNILKTAPAQKQEE